MAVTIDEAPVARRRRAPLPDDGFVIQDYEILRRIGMANRRRGTERGIDAARAMHQYLKRQAGGEADRMSAASVRAVGTEPVDDIPEALASMYSFCTQDEEDDDGTAYPMGRTLYSALDPGSTLQDMYDEMTCAWQEFFGIDVAFSAIYPTCEVEVPETGVYYIDRGLTIGVYMWFLEQVGIEARLP
jgi:hypothetical protein